MNTYEINARNEVIPYTSGRKCTDTRAWRDATELELQQQDQIQSLERELTAVTEQRDEALSDLEFRRDLYKLQTKLLDDVREQRDEAYAMLRRIARKGEFMDMEGQRLVVFDWLARRHISSENDKCDTPRTHNENKLATVTEQRDRLAEALESIVGESAYEGLPELKQLAIEEALQSLTTNEPTSEKI